MYDIIIVGAGPAGATLARLAGKDFKVLVLERRCLTEHSQKKTYEKCCGGLIAPDAQYMLAKLGLGIPQGILVGPQLFTVRTIDFDSSMERFYQRHYINVDREKFDEWLVSLIPQAVDIRCGCIFKSFEDTADGIKVRYVHNGKEQVEEARLLVGADGAYSNVRKQLVPDAKQPDLYVSIQEWFRAENSLPYFSSIFDSQVTDFYSWTIPKEDTLLVGTAIPYKADAWGRYKLLIDKLRRYGFRLEEKVKTKGALIYRPTKLDQISNGKGKVALIGEAAGWISPSSAEGMSYSFRSAAALAKALEVNFTGYLNEYKANSISLRRNILVKNLKSPFMYNTLIRQTVMRSGLLSMEVMKADID